MKLSIVSVNRHQLVSFETCRSVGMNKGQRHTMLRWKQTFHCPPGVVYNHRARHTNHKEAMQVSHSCSGNQHISKCCLQWSVYTLKGSTVAGGHEACLNWARRARSRPTKECIRIAHRNRRRAVVVCVIVWRIHNNEISLKRLREELEISKLSNPECK